MKRFLRFQYFALLIILVALSVRSTEAATSKQYVNPETAILFADSAQVEDATWTLSALATVTGRISAQYDRGATAHAAFYKWRCHCQLTGTNVIGATIEWYIATSDGTNVDGTVGTADAALATDKRNNLQLIGLTIVDQTTTNVTLTSSGVVFVPDRYISMGVWNATTLPFKTDTAVHGCTLTPIPFEQQ